MDKMNLKEATTFQLLALGARYMACRCNPDSCDACPFYEKGSYEKGSGVYEGEIEPCVSWTFDNPGEALKLCGVDVEYEETVSVEGCEAGTNDDMKHLQKRVADLERQNRILTEDLDTERKVSSETFAECKAYKKALKWALKHMGA